VRTPQQGLDSAVAAIQGDFATFTWAGSHAHPIRVDYTLSKTVNDTVKQVSVTQTFAVQDSSNVKISMQGYTSLHAYDFSSVVTGSTYAGFRSGTIRATAARYVPFGQTSDGNGR
jgi:hypothetical protein